MYTNMSSVFKTFIDLFNDNFFKEVTEIQTNDLMKGEYEKLLRLHEDFKFFEEKNDDKIHVILLGNFSSGKSSTINSLLNLKENERQQTTKQTTDIDITMLIHPQNSSRFGSRTNYGGVTIQKKIIDNPLLENIVLVDTPGSGDLNAILINRHLDEFIIQSDLLLYFFNSHMSLTSDDKPVLLAKQKYFPAIEMKFIITNADYFRLSKDIRQVYNNFDKEEYDSFLVTLIERIHNIPFDDSVPAFKLSSDDFILIDNEETYGIEKLKTYIKNYSSSLTPATKSAIREFKLSTYAKRVVELKRNFLSKMDSKYIVLKSYFNQAQDNIKEYERDVFIANNEQSKRYDKHLKVISGSKAEMHSFLHKIYTSGIQHESIWSDDEITSIFNISQFEGSLREKAKEYMNESISNIRKNLVPIINEFRNTVEDIKVNEVDIEFQLSFDYSKIRFTPEQSSLLRLPETIINKLENVMQSVLGKLGDKIKDFETENESFESRLERHMPVERIEEVVGIARQDIESDLRIHFKNVELFHSGVFSINNVERNLHFPMKKNINDISFTDQEKADLNIYAMDTLFPDYHHYITEFKTTSEQFATRLGAIRTETNLLSEELSGWSGNYTFEPEASSLEELKSLYNQIATKVQSVFSSIKTDVEGRIVDLANNNRHEMNKMKKGRRIIFFSYLIIAAILYLISYGLKNKTVDDSMSWGVVVELFSNSVLSICTLFLGLVHGYFKLAWDKKKEFNSIINSKSVITRELEVRLDKLYTEMNYEHDGILKIYQEMIASHFKKVKYEEKFVPRLYSKLFEIRNKARMMADEFDSFVAILCSKFVVYFTFEEHKLLKISEKIRTKSIEPPMSDLKLEVAKYDKAREMLEEVI